MTRVRILLIDDDCQHVSVTQYALQCEGYDALVAYDGAEGLEAARRHNPNLIILDRTMPGLSGLDVCRLLRRDAQLSEVPILMLTGCSRRGDAVVGLDAGSDDYLTKPFDMAELRARIRALLRRSTPALPVMASGQDEYIAIRFDSDTLRVTIRGREARLTKIQFQLLSYLAQRRDRVMSSRELLQGVWGYDPQSSSDSLVRHHISNLRKKIEPDPANPVYLISERPEGYMLRSRMARPAGEPAQSEPTWRGREAA